MARRYLNASRKFLHIVAALFWLVPGIKIFYVGISRWAPLPSSFIIPVAWALVALIAFTFFIFLRWLRKTSDILERNRGIGCRFIIVSNRPRG